MDSENWVWLPLTGPALKLPSMEYSVYIYGLYCFGDMLREYQPKHSNGQTL